MLPSCLHHSLKTEYVDCSGVNQNSDIESCIRRVWAEDFLRGMDGQIGPLLKVPIFCNIGSKVEDLTTFLNKKDINIVALTGMAIILMDSSKSET